MSLARLEIRALDFPLSFIASNASGAISDGENTDLLLQQGTSQKENGGRGRDTESMAAILSIFKLQ